MHVYMSALVAQLVEHLPCKYVRSHEFESHLRQLIFLKRESGLSQVVLFAISIV